MTRSLGLYADNVLCYCYDLHTEVELHPLIWRSLEPRPACINNSERYYTSTSTGNSVLLSFCDVLSPRLQLSLYSALPVLVLVYTGSSGIL